MKLTSFSIRFAARGNLFGSLCLFLALSGGSRQIGPRTFWGPICHCLANWAPWQQIGPRQIGPRQIGPRHNGPQQIGPLGGKLVSCIIYICIGYIYIYSANNWGNICQLDLCIGFGYILPTIEGCHLEGVSAREQGWGVCIFWNMLYNTYVYSRI